MKPRRLYLLSRNKLILIVVGSFLLGAQLGSLFLSRDGQGSSISSIPIRNLQGREGVIAFSEEAPPQRRRTTASAIFTRVYSNKEWGLGSGPGSHPNATREYRQLLEQFMRSHKIKTVLDIGCGDWQSSQLIDWSPYLYVGVDTVASLITGHKRDFMKENVRFRLLDVITEAEKIPLGFDLIILKDVIQHWTNAKIRAILPVLQKKTCRLLVTNSAGQSYPDQEAKLGGYRGLSYQMTPLSEFQPQLLRSIEITDPESDVKEVLLITGAARN